MNTLDLDAIKIGDRHRKDLGDLTPLVTSIEELGLLLHPIVVTPDGTLVSGHRRLAACQALGWTEAPVTIVGDLTTAAELLMAERDENTCRLDVKPSEVVALGRALEKVLEFRPPGNPPANSGNGAVITGEKRNALGAAAGGWSGRKYDEAKTVVKEAEAGNSVAAAALEEMDRTGKVAPAYRKVAEAKNPSLKPKHPAPPEGPKVRAPHLRRNPNYLSALSVLMGSVDAVAELDSSDLTRAEQLRALKQLTECIRKLGRVRKQMGGEVHVT